MWSMLIIAFLVEKFQRSPTAPIQSSNVAVGLVSRERWNATVSEVLAYPSQVPSGKTTNLVFVQLKHFFQLETWRRSEMTQEPQEKTIKTFSFLESLYSNRSASQVGR